MLRKQVPVMRKARVVVAGVGAGVEEVRAEDGGVPGKTHHCQSQTSVAVLTQRLTLTWIEKKSRKENLTNCLGVLNASGPQMVVKSASASRQSCRGLRVSDGNQLKEGLKWWVCGSSTTLPRPNMDHYEKVCSLLNRLTMYRLHFLDQCQV